MNLQIFKDAFTDNLANRIYDITELYGRSVKKEV